MLTRCSRRCAALAAASSLFSPSSNRLKNSLCARTKKDGAIRREMLWLRKRFALAAMSWAVLLLSLLACASSNSFLRAASSRPLPPPQSELDNLVKRIEARYGHMRGLAADFEQIY